ncbi:MAG TPA: helix-turn-helix domain-containing protein [Pseudonocardiaceae bacterium]|nr:helix-turn-helix domain-containing protein [Pseudonocardiaceae bacterium]
MDAPAARPLRADAARNAERIIRAARDAFAQSGTDVSLEEIARRAGVGVATLYRRFPSKDDLIRSIVEWRYAEQVEPVMAAALADVDPWHGMVATLDAALTVAAEERGIIKASRDPGQLVGGILNRFFPELATIVRRGQAAGQIRADLTPADLPPLVYMLVSTLRLTAPGCADWRRYLALLLDALRPSSASPLPGDSTQAVGDHAQR